MLSLSKPCCVSRTRAFTNARLCLPVLRQGAKRSTIVRHASEPARVHQDVTSSPSPSSSSDSTSTSCTTTSSSLWFKALLTPGAIAQQPAVLISLAVLGLALTADSVHALDLDSLEHTTRATPLFDLAEQEFWGNIARYGRYFVTVMLGTGYVMVRPFQNMFKNPVSAVLGIAGLVGTVVIVKLTLDGMLGLQEYGYDPTTMTQATLYD